jgi:hypothetical protein
MSTAAAAYAHNPYAMSCDASSNGYPCDDVASRPSDDVASNATADSASAPSGTIHARALWDTVTFVPYPASEFAMPTDAVIPDVQDAAKGSDGELVRAFIGQLPYFVTDMQLNWLCYTFGGGNTVVFPERIMKRQPSGDRLPTGCVHAYASRRAVAEMAEGMHKRLLIDDTGVWVAQTKDQLIALDTYVTSMKRDKALRVPHRPYDSVVVQFATSTYVPKHVASTRGLGNTTAAGAGDVPVTPHSRRQPARRPRSPPQAFDDASPERFAQPQQFSTYGAPQQATQRRGYYEAQPPPQQQQYYAPAQQYGGYAEQPQCYAEQPQYYAEPVAEQQQQWPNYHNGYYM